MIPMIPDGWGQRRVRLHHVVFLAEQMRREEFLQHTTIDFVRYDGSDYLVDGQHRLLAVVRSGLPQSFVVITREAKTEEQIGLIYGLTDLNLRRTISDFTSAIGLDTETGLSRTQINEVGSAVVFLKMGFRRPKHVRSIDRVETIASIREYAEYASTYYETVSGCSASIRHAIGRSATLALGIATFCHAAKKYGNRIEEFWHGAIFDDGLKTGDPRKLAYEHLLLATMPTGGYRRVRAHVVTADESARYLATCFNKFIAGDAASLIRPPKKFALAGTDLWLE